LRNFRRGFHSDQVEKWRAEGRFLEPPAPTAIDPG
jgi:hypothetical protein